MSFFSVLFSAQIELLHPKPGFVEMDENVIWQQAQDVIRDAISSKYYCFLIIEILQILK